ncbi:MAG TPA: tRNA pseudouridine(55) synthase TruB [Streptosporangiaceae bacterium]|nr:tRNA pseudouridine(55) synthase TruB [Streptosporangiaceae bacterium]
MTSCSGQGQQSGILVIDKPGGITSHDVVARIRRIAGTRRVGHAGTLDPMATGVLVLGIEKATRLLGHLMLTEKEYVATIRLGQSTSTDDAEGEVTGGASRTVAEEEIRVAIKALTGEIMQIPPQVSAIKVDGQRAYKLTRAGAAPELVARPVTVHSFCVNSISQSGEFTDVGATIRCSSGTYIRSLARDVGVALGVGGHLTSLRRTQVGPFTLLQAVPLDAATAAAIVPLADAAAAAYHHRDLSEGEAASLAHGAPLPPGGAMGPVAAFAPDGTLVALIEDRGGKARPLAVFA